MRWQLDGIGFGTIRIETFERRFELIDAALEAQQLVVLLGHHLVERIERVLNESQFYFERRIQSHLQFKVSGF